MKSALLIIDMQKISYSGYSKESMDKAALRINDAVGLFREKNAPVVWIQQDNGRDAVPRTIPFELIDALKPAKEDKIIVKRYQNSFNKTDLAAFLEKYKIDTPLIAGYCAEYCVLTTYRAALDYDLHPLLLRGGIAGGTPEYIGFVEKICDSVSLEALKASL
jgi:nicotinamidase-related amidase